MYLKWTVSIAARLFPEECEYLTTDNYVKDTPIIPKFSLYVLKLGPNTKSRSLNTILVVSGGHDVIVTFYENYVNLQFRLISA